MSELVLQIDVLDDDGEVAETFEYDEDKVKVGKLATSQLHLDDSSVSRIHAVLERKDGDTFQVVDLGSASGTYVNGDKINKAAVEDGDELRFGDATVRVQIVDPAELRAAEAEATGQAAGGEIPEGHVQLSDGSVVQPYTLQGYYDDAGNYIPGYYDEDATYHYGYGYYDDEGTWRVAHGYYDPEGQWVPTGDPDRQRRSDTEMYTDSFFREGEGQILEVAHLWRDQVLDVQSLETPGSVVVGGHEDNDYVLEDASLQQDRFPLIVFDEERGYRLNFSPRMEGRIQRRGEQMSLQDAISQGLAGESRDVNGAYSLTLSRDMSIRLDFGGNTFLVHFTELPAVAGGSLGVDRAPMVYQSISLAVHIAFMILVFTLPDGYGQLELHDHEAEDRFAELAQPPEEEEEEIEEEYLEEEEQEDQSESEAPEEVEEENQEVEIEGEEDMSDQELQEARDREIAKSTGALSALQGDPQDAIGGDAQSALANMDADHEAQGVGGLGLAGSGRGGAEGEEGVGRADVGTGGGAGPGSADAELDERETIDPQVVPDEPETEGALDREIIQRVVRQNRREITHCYEQQLQRDPNLSGRVTIQWRIAPSGDVVMASVEESTLESTEVEQCMTRRIQRWSFPEPDGGGFVRVSYPWNFSN